MPKDASLDTLKRQRLHCLPALLLSCSLSLVHPTQLTNKSKLQMSVSHVRVRWRIMSACVFVWSADFFEMAAVSNFALYLCNFLLRKTVAVACSLPILCATPSPSRCTTFCRCKLATTCCSCNSVCPIANENVRQLRHLLYA